VRYIALACVLTCLSDGDANAAGPDGYLTLVTLPLCDTWNIGTLWGTCPIVKQTLPAGTHLVTVSTRTVSKTIVVKIVAGAETRLPYVPLP
jgi:hypothetical protein